MLMLPVTGSAQVTLSSSPDAPIPIIPAPLPSTIPEPAANPGWNNTTPTASTAGVFAVPNPILTETFTVLALSAITEILVTTTAVPAASTSPMA